MKFSGLFCSGMIAGAAMSGVSNAQVADITGAGATFPYPIYSNGADAYKSEAGNALNDAWVDSGAGIQQVQAKTVPFCVTEQADLAHKRLRKETALMCI